MVYHIHWSCGSNYIGETARNLLTRLKEHNPGSQKCKTTDVTNNLLDLFENSNHKVDFAKPKILGTARNQTKLFALETLSIDKLTPDINVDQSSITLYLSDTLYCFFFFLLLTAHCTALVSQKYSVYVAVTQQLVYNQQVLRICSTILQLALQWGYFHLRPVFYTFSCFRFYLCWWWT